MYKSIFYSTRIPNLTLSIVGGVTVLLVLFASLHIGNLQAARSASPDPEITQITITHSNSINLYDPAPGAGISRTVYFRAPQPGLVTLTMSISGTAPLTFTAGAAFGNGVRTMTSTTAPWVQPVTYTVPALSGDQLNVPYVVTNTHQLSYQVNLSFIKDTIAPTAIITSPLSSTAITFPVSWNGSDTLSGVATYDVAYKRNDQATWTSWVAGTTNTSGIFTGERGYTYTLRVQARDSVSNVSLPAESVTRIENLPPPPDVYLPLILNHAPVPAVSWTSNPASPLRKQGMTAFTRDIRLVFNSATPPSQMKIRETGAGTWETYNANPPWQLTDGNGLKILIIDFKWAGGQVATVQLEIYLLKNGDFRDGIDTGWNVTGGTLGASIIPNNNQPFLRLGSDIHNCYNGVPFPTSAKAELLLSVPSAQGYRLRFEYVVHTQDKLGGTNNGLYDSFDVYVNSSFNPPNILRTGNATQPATCSGYYAVASPEGGFSYLLNNYAGQDITVSFENWSRYDGYYNTYTDLKKVWVEKAP